MKLVKQNKVIPNLIWNLPRLPLLFLNGGFTLIEILVVILIIGILGAIMLPQYQRAVLKSRYAGLMPIAKAMADSNEAYFLEHGVYADNAQDLPVQGRNNYPDGTALEFGTTSDYAYVLATRDNNFPNNYIVYQKHSGQFPGEIHCEALKDDTQAAEVCKSFGATENKGSILTNTHDTWLLKGSGAGVPPSIAESLDEVEEETNPYDCTKAEQKGYTCFVDEEKGVRTVCSSATLGPKKYCRTKHYNEDNSYSSISCEESLASTGVCSAGNITLYDADGNKTKTGYCIQVNTEGVCTAFSSSYSGTTGGYDYVRFEDGLIGQIRCTYRGENGTCREYRSSFTDSRGTGYDAYQYDAYGNKVVQRACSFSYKDRCLELSSTYYDNTYSNGNLIQTRSCSKDAEGNYTNCGTTYFYEYDSNHRKTSERYCFSLAADGSCTGYLSGLSYDYEYDGQIMIRKTCQSVDSEGHCSEYSSSWDYLKDDEGADIGYGYCSSFNQTTGQCNSYYRYLY